MCCFCCTRLRSLVYFMVTCHMLGGCVLFLNCIYAYFFPPAEGYPDLDINPMLVSNIPVLIGGYSVVAVTFSFFIFRAIDVNSSQQLKWSTLSFTIFQLLIILLQFIFTVMFVDLLSKPYQAGMIFILIINFASSAIYISVLFLYVKKLRREKIGSSKLYRNSWYDNEHPENNNCRNLPSNESTTQSVSSGMTTPNLPVRSETPPPPLPPNIADEATSTIKKENNVTVEETNNANLLENFSQDNDNTSEAETINSNNNQG